MMNIDILDQFRHAYPKLISFNPKIEVIKIDFDENTIPLNPPRTEIWVWHPFIFDNRLIPNEFLGLRVVNVVLSETLPDILTSQKNIPLWKIENPYNYIQFVEDNIKEIRNKLESDTIPKHEALNALTGNFEQHVRYWCDLIRRDFS